MARIKIEDLPVAENLTPEQEALIQGAGLRSFRPTLEALEGREVPAAITGLGISRGLDLTGTVLTIKAPQIASGGYPYSATVRQNDAGQVVVMRSVGNDAVIDGPVTQIVYKGGDSKDIFTNHTDIPSTFSNQQTFDQHNYPNKDRFFRPTSPDFYEGGKIPDTSRGGNVRLTLPDAPPGTKTWAVIVEDSFAPTAKYPTGKFTHLVAYNIIPEGAGQVLSLEDLPSGAREGRDTWTPPNPEAGTGVHNYQFRVYALGEGFVAPDAGATQQQLMDAMQGHITGQTSITGYMDAPTTKTS
jgi:phosphatidylethanolamine-binding protein (PEBP) family uncharacterized protein